MAVLEKYHEYLKLNRNILISLAVSMAISAAFAQSILEQEDYLNTTFTLMMDYLVYFSVFGALYYKYNKKSIFWNQGA